MKSQKGSMGEGEGLSVAIITRNEEENIERCMRSVSWADEIVVVDSFSDDRTVEIAARHTNKVIQHEFTDFANQRQFAVSNCSNDWILSLDADEVVTEALRDEIAEVVNRGVHTAYYVPEANHLLGGWLKHGPAYPMYRIRLFRCSRCTWEGAVHERPVVDGSFGFLDAPLLHYSYPNFESWLTIINMYTSMEAADTPEKPRHMIYRLTMHPIGLFLKHYVIEGGFLDGLRGLILCIIFSIYQQILNIKLWQKYAEGTALVPPPRYCLTPRTRMIRLKKKIRDSNQ